MGKNGFYIFDQDDYEVFLRKGRIIATLRNAIVNHYDGFEVYYQPIVDCQSKQIIGAEALMRFSMITEEGREFVSPMEFIPLLEETGLIIPAGRYILKRSRSNVREMQKYNSRFQDKCQCFLCSDPAGQCGAGYSGCNSKIFITAGMFMC